MLMLLLLPLLLRAPQQQQQQEEEEVVRQSRQKPSDRVISEALCGYDWVCMPHGLDAAGPWGPERKRKRK